MKDLNDNYHVEIKDKFYIIHATKNLIIRLRLNIKFKTILRQKIRKFLEMTMMKL